MLVVGCHTAHGGEVRGNADYIVGPFEGAFILLRVNKKGGALLSDSNEKNIVRTKVFRGRREEMSAALNGRIWG